MDWRDARLGGNVGPGWEPLVDELHAKVLALNPDVIVDQVKEKFGGLRYYVSHNPRTGSEAISAVIDVYEALSLNTCEWCGAPGETTAPEQRWLKTLCAEHQEAWAQGKRWWS